MSANDPSTVVVKVGGSLFDLPDLAMRLRDLRRELSAAHVVFFPGGGKLVDVLRVLDRLHAFGEEASHWLALRVLDVNARLLHTLMPECPVVAWQALVGTHARCAIEKSVADDSACILEPLSFALADDMEPQHLPHTWDVTSDSLAVRAAHLLGADCVLLKSAPIIEASWEQAAQQGLVDPFFPQALYQSPGTKVSVYPMRHFGELS